MTFPSLLTRLYNFMEEFLLCCVFRSYSILTFFQYMVKYSNIVFHMGERLSIYFDQFLIC